jgi:type VI secretion system secreted protein Hcp
MPVDAFIWFRPAEGSGMVKPRGETTDLFFNKFDAFELKDFSFGIENKSTVGSATSGAGGGKAQFNEFTIKKTTDQASPVFYRNCALGAHYECVQLAIRKAGGGGQGDKGGTAGSPYMVFNFATVFTTKIDWSGPGDEGPEESITFAYGALQVGYAKQATTGKMEKFQFTDWSVLTNTAKFPTTNKEEF